MESQIEYISDIDYHNMMLDFSPLPETAAFMPAVFEAQDSKKKASDLVRELLE